MKLFIFHSACMATINQAPGVLHGKHCKKKEDILTTKSTPACLSALLLASFPN